MSAALYPTRLYWVGLRCCARFNGVQLAIDAKPEIGGQAVDAIDYAPGACAMVMERGQGWRDMSEGERHQVLELLKGLPAAAAAHP